MHAGRAGFGAATHLALDLGCGPGWTTQLLQSVVQPARTVGLDASERYVREARGHHPSLEFLRHDVTVAPFPVAAPELLFCRFLLTHLVETQAVLRTWAQAAAPAAMLVIHETEAMQSADPHLSLYYELVAEMQRHHGQDLNIGMRLEADLEASGWRIEHSAGVVVLKAARDMAQLHMPNLRTWGTNAYAARAFDRSEIQALDQALEGIAAGAIEAAPVRYTARQIIAMRVR